MQAERDSLTGLSEVPTSQTPSLVPNTAGWYSEPNQAMELRSQDPALTQLRHKLGLPLQQPVHQSAAVQQTDHGDAGQQGAENCADRASQSEIDRLTSCSYEVRYMDGAICCMQGLIQRNCNTFTPSCAGLTASSPRVFSCLLGSEVDRSAAAAAGTDR